MGRNKQSKFQADESCYYVSGKRHVDVYIGNEISGIFDSAIKSKDNLLAMIRGYALADPMAIAKEHGLFGTLPKNTRYFKFYPSNHEVVDGVPVFAIVSNTKLTPSGAPVYALIYVDWNNDYLDMIEKGMPNHSTEGPGSSESNEYLKWMLNFFKKHSKKIPASEEEIKKLKEVIAHVR